MRGLVHCDIHPDAIIVYGDDLGEDCPFCKLQSEVGTLKEKDNEIRKLKIRVMELEDILHNYQTAKKED